MIDAQLAERIKSQVRERKEQLNSVSRAKLKEEFMRITGKEAHPRFSREWLVLALTRIFQMRLWSQEAGFIPTEIAEGDVKFWLSNTIMLVRRDTLAQERRDEKRAEKIRVASQSGNQKSDTLPMRQATIKWVKGSANPFSKNDPIESVWHRFFETLKRRKEMDWDAVTKWCKRDQAQPSATVVYMMMRDMASCEIIPTTKEAEEDAQSIDNNAQEPLADWPEDNTATQEFPGSVTIPDVENPGWVDPNTETDESTEAL